MKYKSPRAKDSLRDLGVTPSKQRGQNFIIDTEVVSRVFDFGAPQPSENLVEIGPGLGALTERLLGVSGKLAVVEIEPQFCARIRDKFPAIHVEQADVREFDFRKLGDDLTVFGNLPYSFSTEIIFHLLDYAPVIKRAVLMLQREFAERVAAGPGSKTYGAISVNAQMRADIRLGPVIPGESFHPRANVESIMLELSMLKEPRHGVSDLLWLRKVVQGAFLQRRKKLKNSLMASGIFQGEAGVAAALAEACIDPGVRAEQLSIADFARLASTADQHRFVARR